VESGEHDADQALDRPDRHRRTRRHHGAEAKLWTRDATHLAGTGFTRRNPRDLNVPEIGDESAAARALSELAHKLLETAASDIESTNVDLVELDA
jgi:hypothetical protein